MRDVLLIVLVFGSLPFILKRPYIGVLVWSWLSYMNPHRMTWGIAYNMPFAQIVAVALLISLLISKEKKTIPVDGLLVIWILFIIWMSITTIFAIQPGPAWEYYDRAIKIQLLTFITMMCMRDQRRIDLLIWTICISIGFFSTKGGIFTLMTAGQFRVYGPPQSFIGENNALALATLMVFPLMYYLQFIVKNMKVKWGLRLAMFFNGLSVLGSQSRGAFLAILALGSHFWWQTKGKLISGIIIAIFAFGALTFMPSKWMERMQTIETYEEDESAMSRITAWRLSISIANARFLGGGFNPFSLRTYAEYLEPVNTAFVAHSIYFSVLAEHGWPGLILFLSIMLLTWFNLGKIARRTRDDPELKNQNMLARMLVLSLIVYMTGGAFLSLAYFDLPWHIIAIAYLLKHQVTGHLSDKRDQERSSTKSLATLRNDELGTR